MVMKLECRYQSPAVKFGTMRDTSSTVSICRAFKVSPLTDLDRDRDFLSCAFLPGGRHRNFVEGDRDFVGRRSFGSRGWRQPQGKGPRGPQG